MYRCLVENGHPANLAQRLISKRSGWVIGPKRQIQGRSARYLPIDCPRDFIAGHSTQLDLLILLVIKNHGGTEALCHLMNPLHCW